MSGGMMNLEGDCPILHDLLVKEDIGLAALAIRVFGIERRLLLMGSYLDPE